MTNLRRDVGQIADCLVPMLKCIDTYRYDGPDIEQFWHFLKRGIIKRQFEGLEAILKMVDAGLGHFGVTLLRPAYEELIWVEFLDQNPVAANELVTLLARYEIARSVSAQHNYVGAKEMVRGGFTRDFVKTCLANDRDTRNRIKEIGSQLGWPDGTTVPSMAFLSKKVGREREYKFLYHGTSRFVHFSTVEVLRRVWGQKGNVAIGSESFSQYWQDFAMYWGFRVFGELIAHCWDIVDAAAISDERFAELLRLMGSLPKVPIVTPAELRSWNATSS